jgi:putative peptidoglycan lipid II flippase
LNASLGGYLVLSSQEKIPRRGAAQRADSGPATGEVQAMGLFDETTEPMPAAAGEPPLGDRERATPSPRTADTPAAPVPGDLIVGRYRLSSRFSAPAKLQFWRAVDTWSGRQVALTLVDPDAVLPVERVNAILSHTVRLRGLPMPGVATILEVFHTGRFGVVVCEWVPGGTLREIVDTGPSPLGATGAMESLAAVAEAAHRAGLVLSIDHPGRVRISSDGRAILAFPATMPEGTPQDDLRGIGAVFYALLVDRWLPQQPMPEGWSAAELDASGHPQQPAVIKPGIPFLISTAAAGLSRQDGGIGSAATLVALLRQALTETSDGERTLEVGALPPITLPPEGRYAQFRNFGPVDRSEAARRQTLRAFLLVAAVVVVVAVVMAASTLNHLLGESHKPEALDSNRLGLNTARAAPSPSPSPAVRPAAVDTTVKPVRVSVFAPDGAPDNPSDAAKAADGDPATAWSTDTYLDAVPFPTFKQGEGLLLKLPGPIQLSAVTVDLHSTGTVLQVRSSTSDSPAALTETAELTAPTPVQPGHNRIPVQSATPVSNVLVWISTLGTTQGKSRTDISEIKVIAASPPA